MRVARQLAAQQNGDALDYQNPEFKEPGMTTKLDKAIRRELDFGGVLYTVTLAPDGLKIVEKGKRKGHELSWAELIGGSVTLAQNLQQSIALGSDQVPEG